MKLETAIEILERNVNQEGRQMPTDALQAVKLGIEALKSKLEDRRFSLTSPNILLSGEIED